MGKIKSQYAKRIAENANIAISELRAILMSSYDLQANT